MGQGVPASAQEFNWSGFYAGVEAGGASGSSDWTFKSFTDTNGVVFPAAFPGGPPDLELSGGLIGAHLGYLHQSSNGLVLGIDGSLDSASISGSSIFDAFSTPQGVDVLEINALGALNGSVGVANGRLLAYATAGFAFATMHAESSGQCGPGCAYTNTGDFDRTGWNAGAGLAYALTNYMSVAAEYRHYDFGTFDAKVYCEGAPCFETVSMNPSLDTIKARLSFHLGGNN